MKYMYLYHSNVSTMSNFICIMENVMIYYADEIYIFSDIVRLSVVLLSKQTACNTFTKWPPIRTHFQMHFPEWKLLYSDKTFIWSFLTRGQVDIGSGKGLTPNKWQAIALTHWCQNKMAAILQIFSNAFSWMKMYEFWLRFHWSFILRVQLTIFQCWFR